MKKTLAILLFLPLVAFSQLSDNFDDGDFISNPTWAGTTDNFMINSSLQLQLNAVGEGISYLSAAYISEETTEWRFFIRLAFSPSSNNFAQVYLSANSSDLNASPDGYYLQFGESGSNDAIELFKNQAGQPTSICRGTAGLLANSFSVWVKVTRTLAGEWTVFKDLTGTGSYSIEATGTENSLNVGSFFGIFCKYTSSNATKMYLDEVYAGSLIVDNTPPQLSKLEVIDPFDISLTFSETTDSVIITNVLNYSVDGNIGHPNAIVLGESTAQVNLQFGTPFENGKTNTLIVKNITDLAGNIMNDTTVQFSYYEASPNDIVINEIMADPSPVVGLPEWEYVEIYNNTNAVIDLSGWKLVVGESEKIIENTQLPAYGYLILCHENAANELSEFGEVVGFSSFQLTNAGTNLVLLNENGTIISSVTYSDTWYNDAFKKDGGWSIEQIDPTNACGGKNNWKASNAAIGGSPGSINSVNAINNAAPKPERFTVLTKNIIQLWFDQQMDPISLSNTAFYTLNPGNFHPSSVLLNETEPEFVQLVFDQVFAEGTIFILTIDPQVLNCSGLAVEANTEISFGIPNPISAGDIIINEVLFNPLGDGDDYVELYNNTNKIFDIEQLMLGSIHQTIPNPPDTSLKPISENSRLLLPETYVLLSASTTTVLSQFESPNPDNFIEMASFPTFSNDEGTVLLKTKTGVHVDLFSYTDSMHFPLLTTTEGVSLERISFSEPTISADNWHSAAETVGFGTPGYKNSMFKESVSVSGEITVVPEVFSPDSDGRDDVVSIEYRFSQAGFTMNAYVFDANGNQIRHLVKSALIPAEGACFWDGVDENNRKVPVGIYVIYVEIFNLDGLVEHYKKPVVVAFM